MLFNQELDGIVGGVKVGVDKKTNLPCLSLQLMNDQGKQIKVKVRQVNDQVSMLKFGQYVVLRFENIEYFMSEFGNLNFGCDTVTPLRKTAPEGQPKAA